MLPQRRKSAEEIAKLRETMGIPGAVQPEAEAPAGEEAPATPIFEPLPQEDLPPPAPGKAVRSLRKSEQKPVERKAPARVDKSIPIPARRHSEKELLEMRRTQATPPDQSIAHIRNLTVSWPLTTLGYLLPLAGGLLGWLAVWTPTVHEPDFPAMWMADLSRKPWLGTAGFAILATCCALGILLAGWFALKKPRSRHHAGFIAIIAVLIAVFGIIHQFSPTHGP